MIGIGSVVNGKYRLTRLLGDGGMGSVYEAQHTVLGTHVAIKVLHPELARRTGLVERFLQEARVAAQIRSVHVVHVTDIDRTPEGQAYIVMDLLEGEPLSSVLERQQKLPVTTACEYTLQILAALEAAHALGVIHRDLKPENVFVTFVAGKPVLKLIDFGIAKARGDSQQKKLTVAGAVMGTAEYMAPEQARSADRVDARADVYAAGVMLYEMIAGARPVSGDDAHVIALKVERGDVVPLVEVARDVPPEIAGLVHRAMAPRPELRFATATEMRLAIEKANLHGPAAAARAASSPGRTAVGMRKSTDALIAAGDASRLHTVHASPSATAMHAAGYAGLAVPPGPAANHPRRRGRARASMLALLAMLVIGGAAIVAVLAANGTWTSDATQPLPSVVPSFVEEPASSSPSGAANTHVLPISPNNDVPKLDPTRPMAALPAPRSTPSAHPASAPKDAAPVEQPFLLPPAFPNTLPTFPGVPPFPSSFPTSLPTMLPAWPPMPSAGPVPTSPTPNGPGY